MELLLNAVSKMVTGFQEIRIHWPQWHMTLFRVLYGGSNLDFSKSDAKNYNTVKRLLQDLILNSNFINDENLSGK